MLILSPSRNTPQCGWNAKKFSTMCQVAKSKFWLSFPNINSESPYFFYFPDIAWGNNLLYTFLYRTRQQSSGRFLTKSVLRIWPIAILYSFLFRFFCTESLWWTCDCSAHSTTCTGDAAGLLKTLWLLNQLVWPPILHLHSSLIVKINRFWS